MFPRLIATSLLVLLPFSAFAADPIMLKSVKVDITLADLTNAEAATQFAQLSDDLRDAIAALMIDRGDKENGATILIDISELELSNSFTEKFNLADTRLVGSVKVDGPNANPYSTNYDLTVDVNSAKSYFPDGTVVETLPADSEVYYTTLINAFAAAVVQKLDE